MSEEKTLEVVSDFAIGLEALAVKLKFDVAALATNKETKPKAYDPEKIPWKGANGTHGPFERATAEGTSIPEDFVLLVEDLKAHNGKLQHNGFFYWLFPDPPTTVGRKPSKKA